MSQEKKSNKKSLIIVSFVALLVVALAGGGIMYFNTDTGSDASTDTANSSSEMSEDQAVANIEGQKAEELAQNEQLNKETIESRNEYQEYIQSGNTFNAVELVENTLDDAKVQEIKQQVNESDTVTIETPASKKIQITINYKSIGDEDFKNGSLYIKLSDDLKVVAGSMEDSLNNVGSVDDSVYNADKNVIKYGPGSQNAESNNFSVTSNGVFTFIVEVAGDADSTQAITSFIMEEGGDQGKPDVVFIEA